MKNNDKSKERLTVTKRQISIIQDDEKFNIYYLDFKEKILPLTVTLMWFFSNNLTAKI